MNKQNVLIIGGGGREHALAWKIAQSPRLGRLYVAPGNGGTHTIATNVAISAGDVSALLDFAINNNIGLTIVGPDDSLALGIVDAFNAANLKIFGPTRAAAQIESSKTFSKKLMSAAGIPTANFESFTEIDAATAYIDDHSYPLVVKASGLALGKGVSICQSRAEARATLVDMMSIGKYGDAGNSVVIEDFLPGREISIHAFCDGQSAALFPSAQDHKPAYDGDKGPNTGGMGTIAPVPWADEQLLDQARAVVVEPILAALRQSGASFSGLLYPGLMVGDNGFNVLEFNARFGDPETQSYMRLLESDLLEILNACVDGALVSQSIQWSRLTAITVVLASGGYPGSYDKGLKISGLIEAAQLPDIEIFHAGTKQEGSAMLTNGGRVIGVSATGVDLPDAQAKAYAAIQLISFDGMEYRTDIGNKSLSSI